MRLTRIIPCLIKNLLAYNGILFLQVGTMDLVFKVLASLGGDFYCIWHSYLGRESLFREISVAAKQKYC